MQEAGIRNRRARQRGQRLGGRDPSKVVGESTPLIRDREHPSHLGAGQIVTVAQVAHAHAALPYHRIQVQLVAQDACDTRASAGSIRQATAGAHPT